MGQHNRKCVVDSAPEEQTQVSLGVSKNLCLCLWALSELNPTLNWYKYLRSWLWMLKIFFSSGFIIPSTEDLNVDIFSTLRNSGPMLFQLCTASGRIKGIFKSQVAPAHRVEVVRDGGRKEVSS